MLRSIGLLAVASFVLACASAPAPVPAAPATPAQVSAAPMAERLARLHPADRAVVEVNGELVRLAHVPADALPPAAMLHTRGRGQVTVPSGGPALVVMNDGQAHLAYTYVGSLVGYKEGALARDLSLRQALEKALAASAFHQPAKVRVGETDVWCVHDRVPRAEGAAPGYRLTLALFDHDPREPVAAPMEVAAPRKTKKGREVVPTRGPARSGVPFAVVELGGPAAEVGSQPGSLGVSMENATPEGNQAHGLPARAKGARVIAPSSGGPAEKAGIRPGDLLIGVDGEAIASPDDLIRTVSSRSPFTVVQVALLRGMERQELPVTLGLRATSNTIVRNGVGSIPIAVSEVWLAPDGSMAGVSLDRWRPPAEFFLKGKTARDLWKDNDRSTEQAINDTVVDWKTRALPGWLYRASADQLTQAIIDTEKGVLALDLAVRTVKDQVDASARKGADLSPGAGEVEQLLEQRKMLLGVVLQAMKGAAAQKPAL